MALAAPVTTARPVAAVTYAPVLPAPTVTAVVDVLPVHDCVACARYAALLASWGLAVFAVRRASLRVRTDDGVDQELCTACYLELFRAARRAVERSRW